MEWVGNLIKKLCQVIHQLGWTHSWQQPTWVCFFHSPSKTWWRPWCGWSTRLGCWCHTDLDSNPFTLCVSLIKLLTVWESAFLPILWGKHLLIMMVWLSILLCTWHCYWVLHPWEVFCHCPWPALLLWCPQPHLLAVVHSAYHCDNTVFLFSGLAPLNIATTAVPHNEMQFPCRGVGRGGEKMGSHEPQISKRTQKV